MLERTPPLTHPPNTSPVGFSGHVIPSHDIPDHSYKEPQQLEHIADREGLKKLDNGYCCSSLFCRFDKHGGDYVS